MKGAAACTSRPTDQLNVVPVPPPFESSSTATANPPRSSELTCSARESGSMCTTRTHGRLSCFAISHPSEPCNWIRSSPTRSAVPFISSTVALTNTPTVSGPPVAAARIRSPCHVCSQREQSASSPSRCARAIVLLGSFHPAGRGRRSRATRTMRFASSSVTCRFDGAKIMPKKSAPASTATAAASASRSPHILQRLGAGGAPTRERIAAAGDSARIKLSPTNTPFALTASSCSTSARVATPERASNWMSVPSGSIAAMVPVVPISTTNVCRLRLLTPMTFAPAASATSISSLVFTSTNGSIPSCRAACIMAVSRSGCRMATMSNAVSAPAARASRSWYSSTRKSLRSTHTPGERFASTRVSLTRVRSEREPLNHEGSVSTDTVQAPATA
mmetsp:Transcript_14900/g.37161  ORF Transcript_14900/g.37161 Transcript_14900/m.37161 type:complete len:390 (-) Transcript_14900:450-1619(-)